MAISDKILDSLVFEPRYKAPKETLKHKKPTHKNTKFASPSSSSSSKNLKAGFIAPIPHKDNPEDDKITGMFIPFQIYFPLKNYKWGSVPIDAVMPWEVSSRK